MIHVLPANYRNIVMHAVNVAQEPRVLVNQKAVTDLSDRGPLTDASLRAARDLEVRDGTRPILGFQGDSRLMWFSAEFSGVVAHCQKKGWLKIQR